MNCPNCGQPVDQGAAFCGNCGQKLTAASSVPQPPPAPASIQPPVVPSAAPAPTGPAAVSAPIPAATGLPAYAIPHHPVDKKAEAKAIIGVIAGVLAIPGALIPIVGVILGIVGIVLGSMAMHIKRTLAILAMVFGIIGLLTALAVWGYLISKDPKLHHTTLSANLQTVDTPCYTLGISSSLHVSGDTASCSLRAMNASTLALSQTYFSIDASSQPDVTPSNFTASAERAAPTVIKDVSTGTRTYTITSQKPDTFDGESAYFIEAKSNQNTVVQIDFVLHIASNGDNLFVLSNTVVGAGADVHNLATNFQWK